MRSSSPEAESDATKSESVSFRTVDEATQSDQSSIRALPIGLKVLLVSTFIHQFSIGLASVVIPQMELNIFDQDAAHAASVNSVLNPLIGVIGFLSTLSLAALVNVYGRKPFLGIALLAFGVSFIVIALSYNLVGLVISRFLPSLLDCSGSVGYAVVSDQVAAEHFVNVYTKFGAAFGGGILIGPLIAIGLVAIEPKRLPFLACAILTLINLVVLMRFLPETLQWQERKQQAKLELLDEKRRASNMELSVSVKESCADPSEMAAADLTTAAGNEDNPFDFAPPTEEDRAAAAAAAAQTESTPMVAEDSKLELDQNLIQPVPFKYLKPLTWHNVIHTAAINPFNSMSLLISTPVLFRLSISLFFHTIGDNFLAAIIFLYTQVRWGWGTMMNAVLIFSGGVTSISVMVWVGPWMKRKYGEHTMIRMSQYAAIIQQVVVALSPSGYFVFPIAIIGSMNFLWTPTLRAQISRQLPTEQQAALQGAVACVTSIGTIVSNAVANAIFSFVADENSGFYFPGFTFIVAAVFNLIGLLVVLGVETHGLVDPATLKQEECVVTAPLIPTEVQTEVASAPSGCEIPHHKSSLLDEHHFDEMIPVAGSGDVSHASIPLEIEDFELVGLEKPASTMHHQDEKSDNQEIATPPAHLTIT